MTALNKLTRDVDISSRGLYKKIRMASFWAVLVAPAARKQLSSLNAYLPKLLEVNPLQALNSFKHRCNIRQSLPDSTAIL